MAINKVVLGNQTLIDITDTTATAGTIVQGYSAYGANGVKVAGSFDPSIYVEKAGDTMTGTLELQISDQDTTSNGLIIQDNNLDKSSVPVNNQFGIGSQFRDSDGDPVGAVQPILTINNDIGLCVRGCRVVNNETKQNGFSLLIDDLGDPYVSFTSISVREAWKAALTIDDLEDSVDDLETTVGILNTRSSGDGTWVANSSYIGTTYTFKCYRRGIIGIIALDFNKSGTATGSDFQKVGTLPTGFLPYTSFYEQIPIQAQNAHVTIRITSGGNLDLYGNHTTTGRCRCTFAYPLNPNQY